MSEHPGWQGILDDGERILWQGQPDARLRISPAEIRKALPGVVMLAFALFWMVMAAQGSVMFALFGLIFVAISIRNIAEPLLLPAFRRSRTWYTLTDRRALVATDLPFQGRRLVSYPIDRDTPVEYLPGDPPSILFGHPAVDSARRGGFAFVADADRVMGLIREIQRPPLPPADGDAP